MIEYDNFQKALKNLESQNKHHKTLDESLPEWMKEAVAESVIQRFETCWDCLWKVVKRYLEQELGLPEVPGSPKPVLRMAPENHLFSSPAEQWITYADARIATSHDYSGQKAQNTLVLMNDFVDDAIDLYQTMSGERWQ